MSVPLTANEGGGRDSDGCRFSIDAKGRMFALELREIDACSRCGMALYRAHLDAASRLGRPAGEAAIASALAPLPAATTERRETIVARAIATYRALGLASLGIREDQDAFEGKLWLRAAWAARERALRESDAQRSTIVFAPATPEEAQARLEELEQTVLPARTAGASGTVPVEDALAALEAARTALEPVSASEEKPSRRLALERVLGSLDQVEQRLLLLAARERPPGDAARPAPLELDLALACAALRAGDVARRERWLDDASRAAPENIRSAAQRIRELAKIETDFLARTESSLVRGAERTTGERQAELYVLAADVARRRGETAFALSLLSRAPEMPKDRPAARRAALLAALLAKPK
ncbi:hypothetical protein HY251_12865 [bacterium]|nr:hypothetical protein [bacterium]